MTDAAAFFRLEGSLSPRPTLAAPAWLAANAQRVRERLLRLVASAAALPLAVGPLEDEEKALRLAWAGLRGVSEDRLLELGEEYARRFVIPALRPSALRLVETCRGQGFRVVLVSADVEPIVRHVAEAIGADETLCNRLEIRDGEATGRLADPFVGAHLDGAWARRWAADRGVDLLACRAYGGREADAVLLGAVGNPCALHPDARMRRIARQLDWPVVEA